MNTPVRAQLASIAARLARLNAVTDDEIAAQGFMLGATYGLDRAAALGYSDSRNTAKKATLAPEFVRNAVALAKSEPLEPVWLAGFYFSSALMRISALNERIDAMTKARELRGHRFAESFGDTRDQHDSTVCRLRHAEFLNRWAGFQPASPM